MAAPEQPGRSQSSTSLARFRNQNSGTVGEEELNDPRFDFCNSFWGRNDEGYHVLMRRVAGANKTTDELKAFWRERISIEEDYTRRLKKLSQVSLGSDEVGQLREALNNLKVETANQAEAHGGLAKELQEDVARATEEFAGRLSNMKKGLQGSIEKSFRNKGLQQGHVDKARERYEQDCLKLNSYHANSEITQGREREKLLEKIDKVQQSIAANEQDFRQFVRVLEGTTQKWEREWKNFCDHFQDLEEDRMAVTKDVIWSYANAISTSAVLEDEACERIREKLEIFDPQVDMANFAHSWGPGPEIYESQRFVNYSAGEYPQISAPRYADFKRLSTKPAEIEESQDRSVPPLAPAKPQAGPASSPPPSATIPNGAYGTFMNTTADKIQFSDALQRMSLNDPPVGSSSGAPAQQPERKIPFGGVALPGMTSPSPPQPASKSPIAPSSSVPDRTSSFGAMPTPPSMTMPEPRVPSRQGPPSPIRDIKDDDDPMARALADLRREPPPPSSVRRAPSSKRANSILSQTGRGPLASQSQPIRAASPAGNQSRMSYQQPPTQAQPDPRSQSHRGQQSLDMTLSPPAAGHTAAQLAKSMEEFQRSASRGPGDKRGSVNYHNYADDVVGAHPTSRPSTPSGQRAPCPSAAMMQPPQMPRSPVADEVLSRYHQALPGERSRSRAGSVRSRRSRANSYVEVGQPYPPAGDAGPAREAFAGIGAGGARSPSPQPPVFRSPSPSPNVPQSGALGPQNLGIALDEKVGVAHDSMAEAYRRQYQQQQQQPPPAAVPPPQPAYASRPGSQYGHSQGGPESSQSHGGYAAQSRQQQAPQSIKSPTVASAGGAGMQRPTSGYGQYSQQGHGGQGIQSPPQPQQPPYQQYQPPSQGSYTGAQQPQQPAYAQQRQAQQPPPQQQFASTNGYGHPQQPQQPVQQYAQQQQYQQPPQAQPQQQYGRSASPAPQHPAQQQQQQYGGYGRVPSPQPVQQQQQPQYGQQTYQQANRSPSPQPGVPPSNAAPTGQWSTTGLPVLFYVKALYDYTAQSPAEFDFQSGDIIAVTSTPEDGWWSGELLDEARRLPGRNDFPSNL